MAEYRIPQENLDQLRTKIGKLNKKAAKLNCEPIVMTVATEPEDVVDEETGEVARFFKVTVEGTAPIINGWEFVATINHLEEANLLRAVPGKQIPLHFRDVPSWCQHCKQSRRRNDTYIVRNVETDEHLQVGSSCLKDFLGHADPHGYAHWAEYLAELDEFAQSLEARGESSGYALFSLELFLEIVSALIRTEGWTSKTQANDSYGEKVATADIAWNILTDRKTKMLQELGINEQDTALVQEATDWINEQFGNDSLNDYMYNLTVAIHRGVVDYRTKGIAASLISTYMRTKEKELSHNRAKQNSEHLGQPKQKLNLEAILVGINYIEHEFGVKTVYRFLNGDNVLIWYSSRNVGLVQGDSYMLSGTVKRHDSYKGVKQTILTRCKALNLSKPIEIDQVIV